MATKSKKTSYDLNAADRRRNLLIQIGLTAVVVLLGVGLVLYIVMGADKKPESGEAKSIRVTSSKLITKEGTSEPKAVLGLYEDFLCPACGNFEKEYGRTVSNLIDSGAVAADYYMVSILDRAGDGYSSRASNAAYCVADESKDAFRRFHAALYAQQPQENVGPFPDNETLIKTARLAGAGGDVPECITKGRYEEMAQGLASATGVSSTPTIRINGADYELKSPEDLVNKIKEIVGDVPGLVAASPNPDPTQPPAPPAAP